jgi:hypothetical protein
MAKDYSINNTDNYFEKYEYNKHADILQCYVDLINEFIEYAHENIIVQNIDFYLFIVKRGIETISNVFSLLLLYTKNHEMTLYHCKKSYYYYVEFIGQIGYDNNSYLQLNSKDAALFVYKKTIFDINSEHRNLFELSNTEKEFLYSINIVIKITNELVLYLLNIYKNDELKISKCLKHLNNITSQTMFKKLSLEKRVNKGKCCLFLFQTLQLKNLEAEKYARLCFIFSKKINKKQINLSTIREKLYSKKCHELLPKYTPLKFVNWLFSV